MKKVDVSQIEVLGAVVRWKVRLKEHIHVRVTDKTGGLEQAGSVCG